MILLFLLAAGVAGFPAQESSDPASRKVLGSSVVTSVSVIMDAKETHYADAVGKPVAKPQSASQVASPINLLNPDRYEFYTFDDSGDLVKRLMTLEEIQSIIANGDGESFNYNAESYTPEKKVNDVVNNVQNVLKEEILSHKNTSVAPVLDTPDVSSSWSMILPAIFGNSGEQIHPNKPINSVTADTIVVEDQTPIVQKPMPFTPSKPTTQKITKKPLVSTANTQTGVPSITVAIISNKNKVSVKPTTTKKPIAHKPAPTIINNQEVFKDAPIKIKPSTYRPSTYKVPSAKPQQYDDDEYPNQHKPTTVKPRTTTTRTTTTIPTTKSTTAASGEPATTTKRVYFEEFEELAQPIETTTGKTSTAFIKLDTQKPVSQFIQLFEFPTTPKAMIDDDEIPSSRMTEATVKTTSATSPSPSEYGTTVFVIDHKTNTKIPITTKEQLTTLLNSLPHDSTTELLKSSSSNNFVQSVSNDDSEYIQSPVTVVTKVTQTTEGLPVQSLEKNNAQFEDDEIPSYVKTTTTQENKYPTTEDIDKISVPEILDQLLLTSTNIYEINTELGNKVTQQTTENLAAASTNAFQKTEPTTLRLEPTTLEKEQEFTTQERTVESTTLQKEYALPLQQIETTTPEKSFEVTSQKEGEATTLESRNESTTPEKDFETTTLQRLEETTLPKLGDSEATILQKVVTLQKGEDSTTLQNDKDIATEENLSTKVTSENNNDTDKTTTLKMQETTTSSIISDTSTPVMKQETTTFEKLESTTMQKQDTTIITEQNTEETEPNIINSIEQLIQQAVGNIADSISNERDGENVGAIMTSMNDKPMSVLQMESATAASALLDKTADQETTTVLKENEKTTELDILSEAMDSIISQVVSSERQGLTTLEFSTTPEQKTTDAVIETTEALKDNVGANSEHGDRFEESEIGTTTEVKGDETTAQAEYFTEKTTQRVFSLFDPSEIQSIQDVINEETATDSAESSNEILNTEASSYIDEGLTTDKSVKNEDTTVSEGATTNNDSSDMISTTNQEYPTTRAIEATTTPMDNYETTVTPIKIVYDEEYTTEAQKSTEFERKTTLIAIITKPAAQYEDGELVTRQSESTQSTVLKPDFKKESELVTSQSQSTQSTVLKPDSELVTSQSQSTQSAVLKPDSELVTSQSQSTQSTVLKPDFKKDNELVTSQTQNKNQSTVLTSDALVTSQSQTTQSTVLKPGFKKETEPATSQPQSTPSTVLKPDLKKDDSLDAHKWSLVSTISPISATQHVQLNKNQADSKPVTLENEQGFGLEDTTSHLDPDIYQFVSLCNELAFGFWNSVNNGMSAARSVFISPFAATSLLAMVFLGARGATSGEMNEILRLDDMVTFNPHLILKNITESIAVDKKSGVATSVILRELYSDKSKGHLLNFYKERAKQFYDGHVEEVSFKEVGDVIRRRTNLIVKRETWGKVQEYIKDSSITVKPPLAGVSVSIFQTDCSVASTEGRDGELYFVVLPSIRQRRLIPVPAAVWRSGFLAGYEPGLDATAVSIGGKSQTISTIFVIPGQQGISAPGDGLARLERHLVSSAFKDGAWTRLLKSLIPRPGLEVQIPRYSHRSVINASVALQHMGMKDLFDSHKADLRGLNGVANDLYLSDILQINSFATCGEDGIGDTHHSEIYPATANRTFRRSKKFKDVLQPDNAFYDSELLEEPRDYQRAFHDPLHDPSLYALPLPLRPRQARLPDAPRLRFDRPFLYFVRHNPTGLILHMGRFNPRLLP